MSYPSKRSTAFLALLQRRLVILDGAMGTMVPPPLRGDLDALSVTRPHLIAAIHRRYLAAGADVISTNTFNGSTLSQAGDGPVPQVNELNHTSARLARTLADEAFALTGIPRFVAGVMGPTTAYAQACRALIDGGVDMLLIETVVDIEKARAATSAARTVMNDRGVELPLIVSAVLDDAGHTLSGQTPEAFWVAIRDARPAIVGFNCVSPGLHLWQPIADLARVADCGICLYPSGGLPDAAGHYAQSPASLAELLGRFARHGLLNMAGGCCGTTPDHIRALAQAVAGVPPRAYQGAGL